MLASQQAQVGPSPRVRGSPSACPQPETATRSIPACAGEPSSYPGHRTKNAVHPRVCGGACTYSYPLTAFLGPSPRVRGSHSDRSGRRPDSGSIPACAGEPALGSRRIPLFRVHPRVCGGAAAVVSPRVDRTGPSPRVRGSRDQGGGVAVGLGSIPACAGEPHPPLVSSASLQVHPRVCGGASCCQATGVSRLGPSPRVRGSRAAKRETDHDDGSIPACAGEPSRSQTRTSVGKVHPRVCGGAGGNTAGSVSLQGPSPRVRGSRSGTNTADVPQTGPSPRVRGSLPAPSSSEDVPVGSIPACAGEPPALERRRVRPAGSIPACAGEPSACGPSPVESATVKGPSPRVRGSRSRTSSHATMVPGPSPRVRGSPVSPSRLVHPRVCGGASMAGANSMERRSIPACAGEPRESVERVAARWGPSPRVRGSPVLLRRGRSPAPGPSPRVRGSHPRKGSCGVHPRCFAKRGPSPRVRGSRRCSLAVRGPSPRVRGRSTGFEPMGPSPRVRGSLCQIIDEISGLFSCQ